ncbi:hypothetical protein Elgi_48790 [Paenibacillus elgii]|nr:hypothetical protein Elgi_48790 [Paenibacillus elgii]
MFELHFGVALEYNPFKGRGIAVYRVNDAPSPKCCTLAKLFCRMICYASKLVKMRK